jgi:purine-nucleoside phosphorylase
MAGRFIFGEIAGKEVMVMSGRFHLYEGFSAQEIVFPVQLAKKLGVHTLITTNSAGALNPIYNAGDIMIIEDHINLTGLSPLTGSNDYSIGVRYPSLNNVYDYKLREIVREIAKTVGVKIREGVYAGVHGPETETPAEIKMIRSFGADAVGMSTVFESISAIHSRMKVIGLSVVTDIPNKTDKKITPKEAKKIAKQAEGGVVKLLENVIRKLS